MENRKGTRLSPKFIASKEGYKICHKCLQELPASAEYFSRYKSEPDGLHAYCKECWKAIRSDTKNNREMANKHARDFHAKHRKEECDWQKKYGQTEKGKVNKYKQRHKRRELISKLPINLKPTQWEKCCLYFDNKCAYCGKETALTIEHFIPVTKNGELSINNILPACKSCNSSKHNRSFFEWYKQQKFYSKKREKKILDYLGYNKQTQQLQIGI